MGVARLAASLARGIAAGATARVAVESTRVETTLRFALGLARRAAFDVRVEIAPPRTAELKFARARSLDRQRRTLDVAALGNNFALGFGTEIDLAARIEATGMCDGRGGENTKGREGEQEQALHVLNFDVVFRKEVNGAPT